MTRAVVSPLGAPQEFLKDWAALYQKAGNQTFFQSPAWMSAWLADIPAETKLFRIESSGDDGVTLLGVAGRRARRAPPLIGFSEVRFHEFGAPEHDAIYIEYNDFLTVRSADEYRAPALQALLDHLDNIDSLVFRNVTPAMFEALKEIAESRSMALRMLSEQPVYVCDLATPRGDGVDFIDTLSAGLRSDIRRSTRIYEERGALGVHVAQSDDEKSRAWEKLVALHSARWRARGQAGAFANPHFLSFHEKLRRAAPDACHLVEIKNGDQTLGVLYNFAWGDTVMHYQSGFLYEDDKRLTPGLVCHALACQYYMGEGFQFYDFLAGEAEYKRRFGVEATKVFSVVLDRPGWRRAARNLAKGL